jgi:hypothetical protein
MMSTGESALAWRHLRPGLDFSETYPVFTVAFDGPFLEEPPENI